MRTVSIGASDGIWAGAVAAALAGADLEVAAVVDSPDAVADFRSGVAVLAFAAEGLKRGLAVADADVDVLAIAPDDSELMIELLEAGALGFLPQDAGFEDITGAVQQLLEGHAVVPPAALGTLLRRIVERRRINAVDAAALESLTPREREVFEHAAQGRDNEGIAAILFISPATARTHLQRVFRKLDVHTRAEVVAFAARCGLDIEVTE